MSTERKKIIQLIRETAELRHEVLAHGIEEGTLTVELTNRDLAAIVYALSCCWISEYVAASPGYREILDMVGDASATILAADAGPQIDKAINEILSGKENPEVDGDGA